MTTRGCVEADFENNIADYLDRGIAIAKDVKASLGDKAKMKDFREALDGGAASGEINALKEEVEGFSRGFEVIGFNRDEMMFP